MQNDNQLLAWLQSSGIPTTPFAEGQLRLHPEIAIFPSKRMTSLRKAAFALEQAYDALCSILIQQKEFLTEYFSFSPTQEILWNISGGRWRGIARADVFYKNTGEIAIAELNSDTPSGLDEAFLLGQYAESKITGFYNPNKNIAASFTALITEAFHKVSNPSARPTVGIVYPTDIPEDMGLLFLYRQWLQQEGYGVVFGSPWNLRKNSSGRLTLFDAEIDVLIRHYKTDWWCERNNVWKDAQDIPDSRPLLPLIDAIANPLLDGKLNVVNPFGTIVTQNKLSLAFFHENIRLFPEAIQKKIKKYIPLTRRFSSMDPLMLAGEKNHWVLKSDYGCEGAEVVLGCITPADEWKRILGLIVPERWIVQQYFDAEKDEDETINNYGIYLIHGRPQGLYLRRSKGVTGTTSSIAPALERSILAQPKKTSYRTLKPVVPLAHRTQMLLHTYEPTGRWLPFRMPLILYSSIVEDSGQLFHPAVTTERIYSFTSQLSEAVKPEEQFWKSFMIVCDLNGVDSVACAAALSSVTDTVLQIENIAYAHEVVSLQATLGALLYYAPFFKKSGKNKSGTAQFPPLFLLDRCRMTALAQPCMQFNNKHWAYLPGIEVLEQNGIQSILYIHPLNEPCENDDLNEDFVRYSKSGIRIFMLSPEAIGEQRNIDLKTMLEQNEYIPVRRHTVFSYLLPFKEFAGAETMQTL
jgi:glutathionylspermidine synthase